MREGCSVGIEGNKQETQIYAMQGMNECKQKERKRERVSERKRTDCLVDTFFFFFFYPFCGSGSLQALYVLCVWHPSPAPDAPLKVGHVCSWVRWVVKKRRRGECVGNGGERERERAKKGLAEQVRKGRAGQGKDGKDSKEGGREALCTFLLLA